MLRAARIALLVSGLLVAGCASHRGSAAAPAASASASRPASPPPVLGESRGVTKGYGTARPATIDNGGDPTGIVTGVKWSSWGGPRATGTGLAYYDPPGQPVAKSVQERATVVAFDLGTCSGRGAYQAIEWYFPESGGKFSPGSYLNICSWTYSGGGS